MSGAAARGTIRDGKHRDPPGEHREEVLLVVSLTDAKLDGALAELEDGLLEAVKIARESHNVADLVKLHVHLSKIKARPRGNDGKRGPRLSGRKEKELHGSFAEPEE